jgi:hypothetical protein
MSVVLFPGGALAAAFAPSAPFVLVGDRITIDFTIGVTVPGLVEWFMEFTEENPVTTAEWFREVAEEDQGGGITEMPIVIRRLAASSPGAPPFVNLAAGTHRITTQFVRHHQIARIQARAAGTATMLAVVRFGGAAIPPG